MIKWLLNFDDCHVAQFFLLFRYLPFSMGFHTYRDFHTYRENTTLRFCTSTLSFVLEQRHSKSFRVSITIVVANSEIRINPRKES